jgi:hypothetical protein
MNILMRLRLLPYSIAKQNLYFKKLKFKHMCKLSSIDSVRFILLKIITEWVKLFLCHFKFLTMINTIVKAEAVKAGAASYYGSDFDQMMRLLAAPAPQN